MTKLTFEECLASYEALLGDSHPNNGMAIGRGRCVVRGNDGLFGAKRGQKPAEETAFALDAKDWDAERGCWAGESPEDTARFIERPIFIAVVRAADVAKAKASEKSWAAQRYEGILKQARERYGKGWDHMSKDQRDNFIAARILYLVLGQDGEQFKPAQHMVESVYAVHNLHQDQAQ